MVQSSLCSLDLSEQIADLLLRALVECLIRITVPNYAHLEVPLCHLSLKGVLKGFDSGMDSIADVHIFCVGLFKEGTSLSRASTQGSSLPAVESARSFDLEDLWALLLVVAANNHTDAEGTYTA